MKPPLSEANRTARLGRRAYLAGTVGVMAGSAGCTGRLPFVGDDPMEFAASLASVPQSLLDETGYEENDISEIVIEETLEVSERTQEVIVKNWNASYDKSIDLGDFDLPVEKEVQAATFATMSTPRASVFGRSFNPVAEMDAEELAEMAQERYSGLGDLEKFDEYSATILGESTTVAAFEGEAEIIEAGLPIDITLHVAEAIESNDDLVLAIGGYPSEAGDLEREHIITLFEGIEHE